MSLFDSLRTAHSGMNAHRARSEAAGDNIANMFTPGYQRKVVRLEAGAFDNELQRAQGPTGMVFANGASDALASGVRVGRVDRVSRELGSRSEVMKDVTEMMASKSAYELSARSASMARSMALAALEIGRGG